MILSFDSETSGMVKWAEQSSHPGQPRCVEVGAVLDDKDGKNRVVFNAIIRPFNFVISEEVSKIHGITQEMAMDIGLDPIVVFNTIYDMLKKAKKLVCHNINFDAKMLKIEAHNLQLPHLRSIVEEIEHCCTMHTSTNLCKIPKASGYGYKWPSLSEAYRFFFNEDLDNAHTALADTKACRRLYYELIKRGINPAVVKKAS